MILTLAKLCLLMLSYFGYWEYFRKKCNINLYFLPAFTIAVHVAVLLLPGLLNFLGDAATVLYLLGLVLFIQALRREKLQLLKPYLNWGYIWLAVMLVLVMAAVRGKIFVWFDCLTHWATVVKNMLQADRFPTFAQEAVVFSSYPLGSSSAVYYFCRFVSWEEDIQMLAQAFVLLSMLLPVFAWAEKRRWLCTLVIALMGHFLLVYNIPVTDLRVDTLLPLVGTAAVLFLFRHCLAQREEKSLHLYYGFPLLFLTMSVKNTGWFFVAAGLLLIVSTLKKQPGNRKPFAVMTLTLLAGNVLWNRHCDYVFRASESSQHALSVSWFSQRAAEKSLEDIWTILRGAAHYAVTRQELKLMLLWLAVLAVIVWLLAASRKKEFAKLAGVCLVVYVLYTLGVMGMFVFSMPLEQALRLECIDRYTRTIDTAFYYLFTVCAVSLISRAEKNPGGFGAGLVLAALTVFTWYASLGSFVTIFTTEYQPGDRQRVEAVLQEYGVQRGYSYLVCDPDGDYWYSGYVCRYLLDAGKIHQMKVTDESQMAIEKDYDYVIILDENNPVIESWVQKTYPDQAGRQVIQCFK